jgi:hypothetical protein
LLEYGVCGDALDAVMTDRAVNFPEQGGPRIGRFRGLAVVPQAIDEAHGSGSFLAGKRT